mmetsp:Transcript_30675/g.57315  ORF Transcript_30675/g.57315 Transcript_30675/m.57315 type:complete len:130 (+) Transcript_30675:288-677(+)
MLWMLTTTMRPRTMSSTTCWSTKPDNPSGVNAPGHFVCGVSLPSEESEEAKRSPLVFVDAFDGGRQYDVQSLQRFFLERNVILTRDALLERGSEVQIFTRMLYTAVALLLLFHRSLRVQCVFFHVVVFS